MTNFLILMMLVRLYLHCVEKLFVNHCKQSNTSVNHMTAEKYEGVLIRRSLGTNNHFISEVTFEWCSNHLVILFLFLFLELNLVSVSHTTLMYFRAPQKWCTFGFV